MHNEERKEKWREDNLFLFSYVVNSSKYSTLREQAVKLKELRVPTITGHKTWDVKNIHKLTKELREQGYIKPKDKGDK
jgi:hypothetical protein